MKKFFVLATTLAALTGCASIVEGSGQNVRIHTMPQQPGNCTVTNERGSSTVVSPTKVTVKRSKTDLTVACATTSGARGQTTVESELENWWWGNVALLSPLGFFIDGVSGAMWEYPKDVYVPVAGYATTPAATYYTPAPTAPAAAIPAPIQPMATPAPVAPVTAPATAGSIAPLPFGAPTPAPAAR